MSMRERRKRALMMYNALSGSGINWLLRVEFATDRGAIGSGTYAGEVGSVTITDTGSHSTVSGGAWGFTNIAASLDPKIASSALARAQGLMFTMGVGAMGSRFRAGVTSLSLDQALFGLQDGGFINNGLVPDGSFGANQSLWIVLQGTGGYLFRDVSAGVKLAWVSIFNTSDQQLLAEPPSGTGLREVNFMRARQLEGAEWTTLNGLASVNVSSPASGASSTATADAIHDIVFTLDASPTAGERLELRYRVQDASNYWTAYMERNVGNTAWDTKNDSLLAGVATNRISVTGVTATRLRVIVDQSLHDVFTLSGTTWTKRGPQINVSYLNTETAINATYAAGNTVSQKISFRRTSPEYAELSRV